jgi:catechol 2,3-dioxygenase-like lactoylglutathione lyase family enzyme
MSQFKNVNVVFYYVTHWEQTKKFYGEVLEWPVVWASDEVGWIEYGYENQTHIAMNRWSGPGPVPPRNGGGTATLTVDDAYKTTAALRAKGVRCDDVVNIPGVVTYGTFYDPEGNRIQFVSSAPPAA